MQHFNDLTLIFIEPVDQNCDLDEDGGQLGLEVVDDGVGVVAGELKQV